MRILSIDSSIRNIGWAILDATEDIDSGVGLLGSGTIRTKEAGDPELVFEIRTLLKNLIKLNNQDFPEKPPFVDIDPAEAPYSKKNAEAVALLRIRYAIIEKAEGFTYERHVSKRSGKGMTHKALGQNNFAVGIIASTLSESVDDIEFVSAQTWKGRQAKATTRLIVNNQFGLSLIDHNNDQSDAIAIGCWWIRRWTLEQKIAAQGAG